MNLCPAVLNRLAAAGGRHALETSNAQQQHAPAHGKPRQRTQRFGATAQSPTCRATAPPQADAVRAAEAAWHSAHAIALAAASRLAGLEDELGAAEAFARHFQLSAARKREDLRSAQAQARAEEVGPAAWF